MTKCVRPDFAGPLIAGSIDKREVLLRPGGEIPLLSLLPGHHVTSIDRNRGGNMVVAGDTYGMVHLLNHKMMVRSLNQGAAVLDVRFTNETDFVAADTSGRVLLWRPPYAHPSELPFDGDRHVSAQVMAGNDLICFRANGGIAMWNAGGLTAIKCTSDVMPPIPYSVAKGLYWTAVGLAVFPVAAGRLLCVNPMNLETELHSVHDRDFYALFEWEGTLATVAFHESVLKRWRANPFRQVSELEAPPEVIAAGLTTDLHAPLLLVQLDGTARSFSFTESALTPVGAPLTGEFRAFCGVSYQTHTSAATRARDAQAKQCAADVAKAVAEQNPRRAESLVNQHPGVLSEPVRYALLADIAGLDGDIRKQATLRAKLLHTMPQSRAAVASHWRQVHFLMRHMHFEAASEVLNALPATSDSEEAATISEAVSQQAQQIASGTALVAMVEEEAVAHVHVAAALERPVRTRLLLSEWTTTDCWGTCFDVTECVDAIASYLDCRSVSLSYKREQLRVITPDAIGSAEEGVVIGRPLGDGHRLELVYRLRQEDGRTDLIPGVAFTPAREVRDVAAHNDACERFIRMIARGEDYTIWLRTVQQHVDQALGSLVNQKRAYWDRQQS
ncbi:MAG: hypothetical protein HUU46_07415 [Candidatus Hydrogenedentes bacterium]|nr:hypothetical protein [Candidatus Hydrogenedentota bacterium]